MKTYLEGVFATPEIMGFHVDWSVDDCNFGSLTFVRQTDGTIIIDSENMNKDFVKEVLCNLVDNSELESVEGVELKKVDDNEDVW